jgi:hypothetical protein
MKISFEETYYSGTYYSGTLRIKNPKTLQRWKDNGEYQKLIDAEYFYCSSCGRFRLGVVESLGKCCRKTHQNLNR